MLVDICVLRLKKKLIRLIGIYCTAYTFPYILFWHNIRRSLIKKQLTLQLLTSTPLLTEKKRGKKAKKKVEERAVGHEYHSSVQANLKKMRRKIVKICYIQCKMVFTVIVMLHWCLINIINYKKVIYKGQFQMAHFILLFFLYFLYFKICSEQKHIDRTYGYCTVTFLPR